MRLYTASLFYTLLKPTEYINFNFQLSFTTSSDLLYSLFVKLYIKLFLERNKTVCLGPISFLEAVIFLSLNTHHFKSFSLYDPGRNVTESK